MSDQSTHREAEELPLVQLELLESANLGYLEWHTNPSKRFVSAQCWSLVGASDRQGAGYAQWCEQVVSPERKIDWDNLDQLFEDTKRASATLYLHGVQPDGTSIPLKLNLQLAQTQGHDAGLQVNAILSANPAHQSTDSSQELSGHLETIAKGAALGLWHRNLVTGQGYWSDRFWQLLGIKTQERDPPMSFFYQQVHPEDIDKLHETGRAHLEERLPYDIDIRVLGEDGRPRWFNLLAQATWDDSGVPLHLAGSLEDITRHKQAEQQILSGRRFHTLIMNTMEDLLFIKDDQFRIQMANDAFLSLYPEEIRDQVIGTTTIEEYDEAQRNEFLAEDRRALQEGFSETEETIYFPNGQQRSLWTKKIRIEDHQGAQFILGYARDVTGLKEAERKLRTANTELEEFAYRVSHDLRSPLQSSVHLLDYLAAALEKGNLDESKGLLTTVQDSLGSLDSMARDVLNVHRIRHGELTAEEVDIEALIEHILKRHRLDHADLQLTPHYQVDFTPVVDVYGLKLVLENLISNAIKYREPQSANCCVAVKVRSDRRYLHITVEDNGLGIPLESREKLFGMFQRFHPRQAFGSGLGLYMTRQWAERMGGSITATHLDPGTAFEVRIPQQQRAAEN